jgi:hypothetical protein
MTTTTKSILHKTTTIVLVVLTSIMTMTSMSITEARLYSSTSPYSNKNRIPSRLPTTTSSLCDYIHPEELPPECTCSEPSRYSLVIECLKTFNTTFWNDTIGLKINIDPCNTNGSRVELDVTEQDHDIDYPITGIRSGKANIIPIPGLSIAVPKLGHVGLDVAVLFTGNPDSLTLKIGIDACMELRRTTSLCASIIPGLHQVLPWYVLSGTYSFGDVCRNNNNNNSTSSNSNNNHNINRTEEKQVTIE